MIPDHNNRLLASDIEADNLLDKVTKLWCIVSKDIITKELFVFHNYPEFDNEIVIDPYDDKQYTIPPRTGTFEEGVEFWKRVANSNGRLIVHNAFGYDKKVLEMFYPDFNTPDYAWVDTLIQSKNQWYDRPPVKGCKGIHGLDAWGGRFGVNKPSVTDWSTMDAFKLHRCIQDVDIQELTYLKLESERRKLLAKGIDLRGGLAVDSEYVQGATDQFLNGALLDVEHIERCLVDLDDKIENLRKEIEPKLPKIIKGKSGTKMFTKEVVEYLGFNSRRFRNAVKEDWSSGKKEYVEYKSFYKPVKTFTTTKKGKSYRAFHSDYGASPEFTKRTDFTAWRNSNYPDTKPRDWEVITKDTEQVFLNSATCEWFDLQPTDTDKIVGAFTKITIEDAKMTQADIVKKFLLSLGWKPTEFNYRKDKNKQLIRDAKGNLVPSTPKLTEDSYASLPDGLGKKIADYNTYCHRRRYLANEDDDEKGILHLKRKDNRLGCGINVFNTSTSRSSHRGWVNAPSSSALYGENIRRCIIAPEGKMLVSADAASAQLSIAAFYANNYDYYKAVVDGNQFKVDDKGREILHPETGKPWYIGESGHCVNSRAFGLISEEDHNLAIQTQDQELIHKLDLLRKSSKGCTFSTIFGASGKKLASLAGVSSQMGEKMKEDFLYKIGLDSAIEECKAMIKKYNRGNGGYIELPMGYYAYCTQPHKFFNYLDQGTEAVCQKLAVNYFNKSILQNRISKEVKVIIDYQDEFTAECNEDIANDIGELMSKSYKFASDTVYEWICTKSGWWKGSKQPTFAFNLDGGYKIGKNYWDVH